MELTSGAFEAGTAFPVRHAKDGEDISPPLEWSDVPRDARELALIFENTSEPREWNGLDEGFLAACGFEPRPDRRSGRVGDPE